MSVQRRESVRYTDADGVVRQQQVVEVAPSTRNVLVSRISQLLWFVATVVVLIIAFRFVLLLLAANPNNDFSAFILRISDPLVAPFAGILASPRLAGGAVIELASVFAIVVYLLVAWGVVTLFRLLFAGPRRASRVTTIERELP
jgi:uncharacterized protein YggT (Ycf19 family)